MTDNADYRQARFSEDYTHIIDSDGNRVELGDPRVVHFYPFSSSNYTQRLTGSFYRKRGWKLRISGRTNPEALRHARELCSGRECLPCASITGSIYTDMLKNRGKDEITVYYNLDQDGPCQNGAWPVVWETFARRLKARNVIYGVSLGSVSNYVGQGGALASELATAITVGDLLDEARNTVQCLAVNRDSALTMFEAETDRVIDSAETGERALKRALKTWAQNTDTIPLRSSVESAPKVLVFGGLNVMFVQEPITEFFLERGIIAKVVDFGEGINWLTGEPLIRHGLKRGLLSAKDMFGIASLLFSIFNPRNNFREAIAAVRARLLLTALDFYARRYRRIMGRSRLVYGVHVPFYKIVEEGGKTLSLMGCSETPITVGRYLCSITSGAFDGMVNVGCFNCQPAMNSQAVLRPLAGAADVPYAAIDLEGPWISANQRRLLEVIAVQAERVREKKNT